MRPDIVPGATFPDYSLPDHTNTVRTLSEAQGGDPLILTLARGHYCPKEHQQHLELAANYPKIAVAYTQVVTIAHRRPSHAAGICPRRPASPGTTRCPHRRAAVARAGRAEREQSCALGLHCGQARFTHQPGADPHVKMQPILDDLALGDALEEQSRACT